jgi:hypothetical protein
MPGFASLALLAQLAPSSRASFTTSLVAVLVITVGLFGVPFVIAVLGEWRARRRAAALRLAVEGRLGPLKPGETVLAGVIESDDSPGRVVAVEMQQVRVTYAVKGGTQTRWDEVSREVSARPFHLRLEDGRSVRVEPDARTFVVDALDGTRNEFADRRVRSAEVSVGDRVFVIGTLAPGFDPRVQVQSGYRGQRSEALVLRPPAGGRMLVSTEVPTERHIRREGFHGNWAMVFAVALLLTHLTGFRTFDVLALSGEPVTATVTERTQRWVRLKNGGYYQQQVTAEYENVSGRRIVLRDDLSAAGGASLLVGQPVTFVVSSFSANIAQVESPGISILSIVFSSLLGVLLCIVYGASERQNRPWYDQRRFSEHPHARR